MTEFFDAKETMTAEERESYLNERLRWVVQYAYERTQSMKDRLDGAGVAPSQIRTIRDLEAIPIIKKDDLIDLQKDNPPFGGLLAVPIEEVRRVYVSPGPIFEAQSDSEDFWHRQMQIIHGMGFRRGDIVVNTWSYHLVNAAHLMDGALKRLGATVVPTGVGNTELQVQIMHRLKANAFGGTAGFLMTVIKKAEEMGYNIRKDFNLRLAQAGGEMGSGPIRSVIENDYGIPTRDAYGTADVGVIAFECGQGTGMHIAEDMIIEIVEPNSKKRLGPGELGEVVITIFDEAYPLICYSTGDLSAYTDEPCPCGRTSPKLTGIMGRVGDAVRTRGMFIHPRQIEPALATFSEISKYQAVVTRVEYRDEVILRVEPVREEGIDKEGLAKKLQQSFNEAVRIKLDRVEFVAKGLIPEGHKLIVDERVY